MTMLSAYITGCAGERLTAEEWRLFQEVRPCGLILFDRNCQSPEQVRALIDSFHDAVGRDGLLILIDQEGGRVQRLKPPFWRKLPPAGAFGAMFEADPDRAVEAAEAASRLVAHELRSVGINTNCAPVLDLRVPGAHGIIGDRAYGSDPAVVAELGRAVADGLLAGGVVPVIKHLPGHGRARCDSHVELPVIEADLEELRETDFVPFRALGDLPAAMTAHVVLAPIDRGQPATTSRRVIEEVIRGEIGFEGLLLSDDIGMRALSGPFGARLEASLAAGCDVGLHCSGKLAEMREIADAAPLLEGDAEQRYLAALGAVKPPETFDASQSLAALQAAFAAVA